jgi:DNA-binding winged helix-turn-helix (wHTH) protein
MPHSPRFEFGPFQLDLNDRLLTRAGEVISLRPKATEILVRLVTNAGQLIKKDQLLKEVWPDTFVEESNLSQTIFTLRKALGDDRSEPRYIETVPRRGYRFVAAVRDEEAQKDQTEPVQAAISTASITQRQVVAVLPFLNQTGNSEFEYLADGITGNLINNLSRLSKVRVLSHSAVSAFKTETLIPQQAGKELGATVVLCGKLSTRPTGIAIGVELVDASTGWQLWGDCFDFNSKDLSEIQNTITRDLTKILKSTLIGDEEKQLATRYTENAAAHESYLEARRHWSEYTRSGIEEAIGHFLQAIEFDPNYALAYAGIVDSFLRLATNYSPPEGVYVGEIPHHPTMRSYHLNESNRRVELRFEWDCKGVERELRRAIELKTGYPSTHQWYAAYRMAQQLYEESHARNSPKNKPINIHRKHDLSVPSQIAFLELTLNEEAQVYCAIGREQIDIGNYKAACRILRPWWSFGIWPKLDGLNQLSCADLLLTVGELAGCVASTKQLPRGQKHSEELLNGSVALSEQLGFRKLAAEGRIELAYCYFRQGLFDVGRTTLSRVLDELTDDCWELRSLALIRLAALERMAGRPKEALIILSEAKDIAELCGPWATGRCHLELASTYKHLALAEPLVNYFDEALSFYSMALCEFEGIGNHRLSAITENNLGLVMSCIGNFEAAEYHLLRARKTFDSFDDRIRCAQVDESLAQMHFAQGRFDDANLSIQRAVKTMETGDEDVFLIEALTTQGLIYSKLRRYSQAKTLFENAYRLAQRCGDIEGAGRALTLLVEEMFDRLEPDEQNDIANRIVELICRSQKVSIHERLKKCVAITRRK